MKDALDLRSKSGIHRLITALEERGFIRRLAHRARAIEIIKLPDSLDGRRRGLPASVIEGGRPDRPASARSRWRHGARSRFGSWAASPRARRSRRSSTSRTTSRFRPRCSAAAAGTTRSRSRATSMIEAGINSGDIVVIQEQSTAEQRRHRRRADRRRGGDAQDLPPSRRDHRARSREPGLRDPALSGSSGPGAGQARRPDPHLLNPIADACAVDEGLATTLFVRRGARGATKASGDGRVGQAP